MHKSLVVFFVFILGLSGCLGIDPGPKYLPTRGEVWPKPQRERKENVFYKFKHQDFDIQITDHTCPILANAVTRYLLILEQQQATAQRLRTWRRGGGSHRRGSDYGGLLRSLQVELSNPCEEYPQFGMDESYNLTVSSVAKLTSESIWGVLRGLESFTHLFYLSFDYTELLINKTVIYDFPRYAHRGLMLDTSRHFITMPTILGTLDAMAINKMNVFHWHIVDDQSFPYESDKFPNLSQQGAYHQSMVYTKKDMNEVVEYARDRGIRVLPEFDVPGHTRSWGVAFPQILTPCYEDNKQIGLGPMNPISNTTYKLLRELLQEVQERFPDKYFHLGGDEVDLDCWSTNPYLLEYMLHHNMSSVTDLHALFMTKVIPLLGTGSKPIVWQEVFDENVPLSKDAIVQVWKDGWVPEMNEVLASGHRVLFSTEWYLSVLDSGGDWEKFYIQDPRAKVTDRKLVHQVIGGETCMWGEYVDDRNVVSRVWPRASAIAERLWSFGFLDQPHWKQNDSLLHFGGTIPRKRYQDLEKVRHRIEEHACRMLRRGINAQPPNGPGFCVT